MKRSLSERISYVLILILMGFLMLITLYPFWYIIMYALSDSRAALSGGLFLVPKQFSLSAIRSILHSNQLFQAYGNTIYITVVGTFINLLLTTMLAYPLSLARIRMKNVIVMMIFFTMLFGGGMIPGYLLVKNLGLIDSHWALMLPGAVSAWNTFLMRNYFKSLPDSLEESARIDGAGAMRIMVQIIIPLSAPIFATMALFYAVGHWNSYFGCVLYINTRSKQVLQVYLRTLLSSASALDQLNGTGLNADTMNLTEESMKMASVVASVVPMLIAYPFVQKYYVKGLMVGSVKG